MGTMRKLCGFQRKAVGNMIRATVSTTARQVATSPLGKVMLVGTAPLYNEHSSLLACVSMVERRVVSRKTS